MRSIAFDTMKAQRRESAALAGCPELHLVNVVEDGADDTAISPLPTPEAELAAEEEAVRIKDAILALFADDLAAQTIVEGDMEGMNAEEIGLSSGSTN